MIDPESFDVLTFDCYGTLIDWETGIFEALRPVLRAHGKTISDAHLLELYGEFEAEAETGPYRSYREVLASVVLSLGQRLGFRAKTEEANALAKSLPRWQPWPDTVAALSRLGSRYGLAIISNIDDDLFATTRPKLGANLTHVITAQQSGCYKPDPKIFQRALAQIAVPAGRVLHVGQSIYHDVRPAQSLGMAAVWVNRPSARANVGAVRQIEGIPDLEVRDMKSLAEILLSKDRDESHAE
jgi:2-haloacid dehalogenase